jgi:putative transposase
VFLATLRFTPDVSTRKVDDLVQSMGMTGISKSQVSRLCSELDEQVKAFLECPLSGERAYVWFDATYVKSRNGGRVVSRAIVVAVGTAETEAFWMESLRCLVARGLSGVRLVISDAHIGLENAIGQVLGATWQRTPKAAPDGRFGDTNCLRAGEP